MTPDRKGVVLRRRLVAAGVLAALAAAITTAILAGSGDDHPHYAPGGVVGTPTVIAPTSASPPTRQKPSAFTPAPAAVTLAASMSVPQQVAQLFVVPAGPGAIAPAGAGGLVGPSAPPFAGGAAPRPLIVDAPAAPDGSAATAARVKAAGFNMVLGPYADVDTPGGPLSGRLLSTDPATVARLVSAAVGAYGSSGVISAVGHFPGSGSASADPDQQTATVGGSLATLRSRDLIPFEAVAARAPVIEMSNASYVAFDGVTPASLLPAAVTLLRHEVGFQGVVISDDLDATLQATGEQIGPTALEAIRAGDDLLYLTGSAAERDAAYNAILTAATHNAAVKALVHNAVLRILTLKAKYGLI